MCKYNVVMNIKEEPWQTDLLLATDDINKAIEHARTFNDKDVEIRTNITETSYDIVKY